MPANPSAYSPSSVARIAALASVNNTLIKTGPTQVYKINIYNNAAYAVFLKLFNKATVPAAGTDTPVLIIGIPATATGASVVVDLDGINFPLGLGYAITKLIADSDTTVVVTNDIQGHIQYQ